MSSLVHDSLNLQRASRWFVAGILIVPLSTMAHELAHYVVAWVFGASDLTLYHASIHADMAGKHPAKAAAVHIAGPLISWILSLVSVRLSRQTVTPAIAALGVEANLRSLIGLVYLFMVLLGRGDSISANFDEYNFANAAGLSPVIPVLLSLGIFGWAAFYISRRVYRDVGGRALALIWAGTFAGMFGWSVLGPMVIG